jgi:hypothetical protein
MLNILIRVITRYLPNTILAALDDEVIHLGRAILSIDNSFSSDWRKFYASVFDYVDIGVLFIEFLRIPKRFHS